MTAFLDPPPTPEERARAFIDVLYGRPLRREDYAGRAAADRALWLRGWALSKFVRNWPGFRLIGAFHDALRQGNLTATHDLLKQFEEEARSIHPNWNSKPHVALMARLLDAAEKGQAPEECPVEVHFLVAYWVHETSDVAEVLTELGFNRRALRRQECKVAQDTFRATEEAGEALIDHILRAGLHLAQKDVPPDALRTEPLRDVARKVRGRQRKEVLQELPQAERERARQERRRQIVPYDPDLHGGDGVSPLPEDTVETLKRINSLPPAQRRAAMMAIRADAEGRELKEQCAREGLRYKAVHEALRQARRSLSS
jgi:hypothetical protein